MSNKAFITKFPVSVDNDNLLQLGELKFTISEVTESQEVVLGVTSGASLEIKTSQTVSVGKYKSIDTTNKDNLIETVTTDSITLSSFVRAVIIKAVEGLIISIKSKYDISKIRLYAVKLSDFSLENVKYSENMIELTLPTATGDLSNIKSFKKIQILSLNNTNVTGDISSLSGLSSLRSLSLNNTNVTGDISSLSGLSSLNSLYAEANVSLAGDISSLPSSMTRIDIANSTNITGDVSTLSRLTEPSVINLYKTNTIGDVSVFDNMTSLTFLSLSQTGISGDATNIVKNLTKLKELTLPTTVTITDEQIKTMTDRGCTVQISKK